MLEQKSEKVITIKAKSLPEIKKLNLRMIGLNKLKDPNIFEYNSSVFKVLRYKIKTRINFAIFFNENNVYIELHSLNGIPKFLKKNITLTIRLDIYEENKVCKANRFISLTCNNNIFFLKFLSEENANKLLLIALESISKRFDKKFLKKIIYS